MRTTTFGREKSAENQESSDCDYDWCDGPQGDAIPCFDCFDPSREYDPGANE